MFSVMVLSHSWRRVFDARPNRFIRCARDNAYGESDCEMVVVVGGGQSIPAGRFVPAFGVRGICLGDVR